MTPDTVDHSAPGGPAPAMEVLRQTAAGFRTAFPDLQVRIEDMVAEGDTVVSRVRLVGTHSGPFQGIPASGKQISVPLIDWLRLRDGLIVERWGVLDTAALMAQIGASPAAGQPAAATA